MLTLYCKLLPLNSENFTIFSPVCQDLKILFQFTGSLFIQDPAGHSFDKIIRYVGAALDLLDLRQYADDVEQNQFPHRFPQTV